MSKRGFGGVEVRVVGEEMHKETTEARPVGRKLILGYDAGCESCAKTAQLVKERVGDKLSVADLRDPYLMAMRVEALGEGANWAPTLFELENGRLTGAWTGWRMGWALSHKLGPAATWHAMQALGEASDASPPALAAPETASGIGRGQFLKGAAGITVATTMLLGSPGWLKSIASAATQYSFRKGTARQVRRAKSVVRNSRQFQRLANLQKEIGAHFDFERAVFRFDGDGDFGVGCVCSSHRERGIAGIFYLDMRRRRIFTYNHHVYLPASSSNEVKRVQILSYQNDRNVRFDHSVILEQRQAASQSLADGSSIDASYDVTTEDGRTRSATQFVEDRRRAQRARVETLRQRINNNRTVTESAGATARVNQAECQHCKDVANLKCTIGTYAACGAIGAGVGSLAAPVIGTAAGAILGGVSCAITVGTSHGCENYANSASGGCLDECSDEPVGSTGGGVCG